MNSRKIAYFGLLTAMTLVLGYIERLIPFAVAGLPPGVKLGLANTVLVYALYLMDAPSAALLMVLKVALSAITFAGFAALPYSAAGAVLSLLVMIVLKRVPGLSVIGISAAGAVFHNVGQVLMVMLITQTPLMALYLAVLLVSGVVTGVVMGAIAQVVIKHMERIHYH